MERKVIIAGLILFFTFSISHAQTTWSEVQTVLQTNCAGSGCHSGTSPVAFDVLAPAADLYAALAETDPLNSTALAKGNKLVDPGHPYNSFLVRKVGNGMDSYFDLDASEDDVTHASGAGLSNYEIELIRQWILYGAKTTDDDVPRDDILEYYDVGGTPFLTPPPAPDPSEGMQVRLGPIFMGKGSAAEREYLLKFDPHLDGPKKVTTLEGIMNWESHHFLLFNFNDLAAAADREDGLKLVSLFSGVTAFDGDKEFRGTWQNDMTLELPDSTAYFWDENTILDLNYHIFNYHTDTIMPADFYMNLYWDNTGSTFQEMKAQLVNNPALVLFPGSNTVPYTHDFGGTRYIWHLSSHTHKYGTDFDIFDGSNGNQIYEGFFNEDYTYNQGFYDWAHPPLRVFEPLYELSGSPGMSVTTEYYNTSGSIVTFGLTVDDEMQLFTYLYTDADVPIHVDEDRDLINSLNVYPNPIMEAGYVSFELENDGEVKVELIDMMGKSVCLLPSRKRKAGKYKLEISKASLNLPPGVYFVQLTSDNKAYSQKVILAN